ncbi:MAG: hypothetical protein K8T10_07295 [Candidatus Eremiobacteraeota bacterium]|nr:hypothetical protein [Candidatus Eremiobacteraeota bacterium]
MEEKTNESVEFPWRSLAEGIENLDRLSMKEFQQYEHLDQGRIPTPVPIRIKSGSIEKDQMVIHTSETTKRIPWEDIELLSLGIVHAERNSGEAPKSSLRIRIRQVLLGDPDRQMDETKEWRDTYLLDIYLKEEQTPYRIDHSSFNYRSILKNPGYVSSNNFRKLVNKIACYSNNSRLDPCLIAYLAQEKRKLKFYNTVYDFELESQVYRKHIHKLIPRIEVNIPEIN